MFLWLNDYIYFVILFFVVFRLVLSRRRTQAQA